MRFLSKITLINSAHIRYGTAALDGNVHFTGTQGVGKMDEIGKLADENIQGILNFANERNILVVNSSPKSARPLSYRRIYVLSKDAKSQTMIQPVLSTRQAATYESDR